MIRVGVMILVLASCGCANQHSAQVRPEHDEAVATLLADLWTPEKETERDALERASKLRDIRIGEALVGKMWTDARLFAPSYYYPQLVVDALRSQGFRVDVLKDEYIVAWPDIPTSVRIPHSCSAPHCP